MTIEVLVPTYGEPTEPFAPAPRVARLAGLAIGIVSNGKRGAEDFFDALGSELRERYRVAHVERVVKPNYSAPAGDDVFDRARRWHAIITGVGD